MTSIRFLLLLVFMPAFFWGMTTLAARRKAAAEAFLTRAREIAPSRATHDYDMVGWPWRFWRWARTLDPSIDDPQLLATSALLKKLDRIWLAVFVGVLTAAAVAIAWYPWPH